MAESSGTRRPREEEMEEDETGASGSGSNGHGDSVDEPEQKRLKKPIRAWSDGVYDLMHYGHANALRQAKMLCDVSVVGVSTDEEVYRVKGVLPVMNTEERYAAVEGCKWVDEMIKDAPYVTDMELMDRLKIDFVVHGEDVATDQHGNDVYAAAKAQGRFKYIKRTEGVSTTDLVGRMLLMTKEHHTDREIDESKIHELSTGPSNLDPKTNVKFLTTSRKIIQFSSNRVPKDSDVIGYTDGSFDLFHAGHISFLKKCREQCDFLIVGVHSDEVVNKHRGSNFPIMNVHERVLSVLACKYVDEVIIGSPYVLTEEMITSLNIAKVFQGSVIEAPIPGLNPYAAAKSRSMYVRVQSDFPHLTVQSIIERVVRHRELYEERNRMKAVKDAKAMANAVKVAEI